MLWSWPQVYSMWPTFNPLHTIRHRRMDCRATGAINIGSGEGCAMTTAYEPHPLSAMFPPLSEEDFGKLAADIKLHGLRQHIVLYQGKILDGNNRYRACSLAGIKPTFADFTGIDADARNYVISVNIHRRHLDPGTRKKILEELLKLNPSQSDRQLGEQTKLDHKTVGVVREKLVAGGEIPHQEKTVGKDGVTQSTTKKGKGGKRGKSGSTK